MTLWNPFAQSTILAHSNFAPASGTSSNNSLGSSSIHDRKEHFAAVRGAALWMQEPSSPSISSRTPQNGWNPLNDPHRIQPLGCTSGNSFRHPQPFLRQAFHQHSNDRNQHRFQGHNNGRYNVRSGGRGFHQGNQNSRNLHSEIYCEACDLEFKNPRLYDEHVQKHLKCPKCQFVGLIDSIEQHYETMHLAHSRKRMTELQTPEELAQWRKERSKKYPRTKAMTVEDVQAGDEQHSSSLNQNLLVMLRHESGLSTLIDYGDSSDSEPETAPIERPVSVFEPWTTSADTSTVDTPVGEEGRAHDTQPSYEKTSISQQPWSNSDKSYRCQFNSRLPRSMPRTSCVMSQRPRTLYEKLRAKDIRKDHDHIFQCMAYIQQQDFFGIK